MNNQKLFSFLVFLLFSFIEFFQIEFRKITNIIFFYQFNQTIKYVLTGLKIITLSSILKFFIIDRRSNKFSNLINNLKK